MTADAHNQVGLRLFTSNRLETLAGKLAGALCHPLPSPLDADVVVVRNKGMERWLKLELARRHGVCANQRFPFPEAFGHEIFRAIVPGLAETEFIDREAMTWRVMKALPEMLDRPGFESVANYLHDPGAQESQPDGRKYLQFAARVANLFDQYLIFRPEMIREWDAGGGAEWQAQLWRAISADLKETHAAALWRRFHEILAQPGVALGELPGRVSIFGVSALSPYYLGLFAALACRVQINLFLLQPSREYWGDITSPREGERILRWQSQPDAGAFETHLEQGNRLLASMGYLGRDFLKLILDAGDWIFDEDFTDPGEDSLLHHVQSDILHLRDRGKDVDSPPREVDPTDDSVQIHSCHSPLREMEVLHDHILDWFQRDATLAPRDIVVMTPDIEVYAPFVQAVFGAPEEPFREIPFSLADRGAHRQSHIVGTFLQILDLSGSRLGAVTVLSLLETEAVRGKFSLNESDLARIRGWVERTNIRWSKDDEQRAELGLPKLSGNTWRAGLDRLLLGYGMSGGGERLFDNILPFDDIEGDAARVLGHFVEFVECVFTTVDDLVRARPLDQWAAMLVAILDRFFQAPDSAELEMQTIRNTLWDLRRQHALSGFAQPVELAVVLERLRPALEEDRFGSGFLTGGVTFCGLKPMRSIPFKIVCLVGLNDGAFPRTTHHLSFDLMAKAPRLGDRSTREDDRYLFLETLLSARERLHISYVGQSVRDNKEAPPSVLVSELLDYVEQGFKLGCAEDNASAVANATQTPPASRAGVSPAQVAQRPVEPGAFDARQARRLPYVAVHGDGERGAKETTLRDHLVLKHRLQAFNEDYFRSGHRLFSYSTENCRASEFTRRQRSGPAPFIPATMGEPEAAFRNVTLDDLARFLANPARFFLNRRLRVFLPEGATELEERETFVLDGLGGFRLKQELLERHRAHLNLADGRILKRASGDLPLGSVGDVDYRRASGRVETFYRRLEEKGLLDWIEPLEIDLPLGEFRLTGRVAPRARSGPLLYRCARSKAGEVLRAWVHHLAANATVQESSVRSRRGNEAEDAVAQASPPPHVGGYQIEEFEARMASGKSLAGCQTTFVAEDEFRCFSAVANAGEELQKLLGHYWQGLAQPLKFFPESAMAFAQAQIAQANGRKPRKNSRHPIEKARDKWDGNVLLSIPGEKDDAHIDLCFRAAEPLDEVFEKLAWQILEPLLRCQTREEL